MDKLKQIAWKKVAELIQVNFTVGCMKYGLEPHYCPLPLDLTQEELDYMMSDYASDQYAKQWNWLDAVTMLDYINFCKTKVRDASDFGIAL